MWTHTWEGPESYQTQTQNQANHSDWPRETWKKCPHKSDSNKGTTLSLSPSMCLDTRTLFLSNKHFTCFTTFPLYAKIHFYITDMPRSCHWPLLPGDLEARIQHSRCNGDFTSLAGHQDSASSRCRLKPPQITIYVLFY